MQNTYAILDFSSVVKHSYNSGKDPDATLVGDKWVNSPGYGLKVIIDRYILPLTAKIPLNHIIVVEDSGNDYRLGLNSDYKKARREKEPSPDYESILKTMELARSLFESLGIPRVSLKGQEADDVIAYLVQNLDGEKEVYTNDGDLIDLAKYEGVEVYQMLERKTMFKKDDVFVKPHHITLFKSLVGDTSDGYGGVRGFGIAKWKELNEDQIKFLDDVVKDYRNTRSRLKVAAERNKIVALIDKEWSSWVHAYHDLAKLHPELVDGRKIAGYELVEEEVVPIKSTEFNRLKWIKRLPSIQTMQEILEVAGHGYMLDKLTHLFPTQTLVTASMMDEQALQDAKRLFTQSRFISLDWETWEVPNENFKKANQGKEFVDMLGSTISGMGITCGDNLEHTFYFQFDHADEENNIRKDLLLELLDAIPANKPVVAHNMNFELSVLMSEFKVTLPIMYDTMIMHCHIDELADSHGLKDLTKSYLGYNQTKYEEVIEKGKTMRDYTGQHVFKYGADDPLVTAHLFDLFYMILNLEGTWEFVRDCEFPTVQLLSESYISGVTFDLDKVAKQRAEDQSSYDNHLGEMRRLLAENKIGVGEAQENALRFYKADINPSGEVDYDAVDKIAEDLIYEPYRELPLEKNQKKAKMKGTELNLDSPLQMQKLMYGTLGLPIKIRDFKVSATRKEKGLEGTPQVNSDAIDEAISSGDASGWKAEVLEHLTAAKKCATRIKLFYNKFGLWEHPKDGNVHPRFNSCGTESRRPTGGSPNLLQLSKKGDGVKVRECIVPNKNKGHDLICSIDWDGEELRVMAALSGDPNLLSCYVGDNLKDAHSIVAAQIMGCSYDEFVKNRKSEDEATAKKFDDIRKSAKNVNFASAYGCGVQKLARMIKEDEETARFYLESKKEAYWRLEEWKEEVKEQLQQDGKVTTKMGSIKHAFNYYGKASSDMRSYYERSSVNFLVQGVCADYLKFVLATLYKNRTFQRHNADLVAPIYDEMVFSCHSSQAVSLIKEVYAVMTMGIPGVDVPMLANPAVGVNFGKQIEVLKDCNQPLTTDLIERAINEALHL
jgi:DNA polymerase I-like protein with 3'-5' exonuclease and polymerase domains/5'-3' exonuclease